jgi:cytochrome P450
MSARQEVSSKPTQKPAWSCDHLDSSSPPQIKAPYFDYSLEAWVISRYADVLDAFRSPDLVPTGANNKKSAAVPDEHARLVMRAETQEALSTAQLDEWRRRLTSLVNSLVDGLPASTEVAQPVDLVSEFGRPLCLALAVMVTGANPHKAGSLDKLARHVSAAAAEPYDAAIRSRAADATAELRGCFHAGPEPLRDSGFVALSHTLPSLLANLWFALLQHPQEWRHLHQHPGLVARGIEELLRYAGLTRILFRRAIADVDLNGVQIRKGDRVVLRIIAANRDPERFSHPGQIDLARRGTGQLALGAGPHACVGASLIRMAAITITRPLLARFVTADLTGPVEWHGGPVFRSPVSLPVLLHKTLP